MSEFSNETKGDVVFQSFRKLVMVVTMLLVISSLFAVSALVSNQARADGIQASPSASPDVMVTPTPTDTASPTPTPTDTATPTPTPSPTVDPAAVILDIAKFKERALAKERKAKKARTELIKRAWALGKQSPKRMLPRRSFDTWEARFNYYKGRLDRYRQLNKQYWRLIYTIHNKGGTFGVNRWIPLLKYCGMPLNQMWRALKVMNGESQGDPTACNSSNHRGLYQFSVDWWYGKWNPYNPYQNILHFVRAIKVPGGWSHWAATA